MKRILPFLLCLLLLSGCGSRIEPGQIAATTLPVYEFTYRLCLGTPLSVTRLVTEQVSCLHDYSLNVRQVKAVESAEVVILSGSGLEDFMEDLLTSSQTIEASQGIPLLCAQEEHGHEESSNEEDGHHHDQDPHVWLSPVHAQSMCRNICQGLSQRYPEYQELFSKNLEQLLGDLDTLQRYGEEQLAHLRCRELITFHDGFSYFAQAFDLTILEAVEEESGSEASAKELITLIQLLRQHELPAVFTEKSGSVSAAGILSRETGCGVYDLDMAMAGDSYFDAMYRNIDAIKEAMK